MKRLLVDQTDITSIYQDEVEEGALTEGDVRMRIQRFALTANNVTYAASGHVIGYWKFFPSGVDGKGIVPVWGFAEVIESRSAVLGVGQRLYGFWPMADTVILKPQNTGGKTLLDATPHRQALPSVYNRYLPVGEAGQGGSQDAGWEAEGLQALLQPLLATSFLLSDWLKDNAFFGAEQVIVGSASSKTGLGLCKFLAEDKARDVRIVGLTSPQNMDFVATQSGADSVVYYGDIETLPKVPSVYVDMAGNGAVKKRLHAHLADDLKHSSAVGISHWDQFEAKQDLAGPKPEFFFAPSQIEKRRQDWGPGEIERQIAAGWKRLAAEAGAWLDLKAQNGWDSAAETYRKIAAGDASPRDGFVVQL